MRRVAVPAALLAALAAGGAAPAADAARGDIRARVTDVVDGATLVTRAGGTTLRVRLLGIDVPRIHPEGSVVECGGLGALDRLLRLTFTRPRDTDADGLADAPGGSGRTVTLRRDTRHGTKDRFGRMLAYVSRGGEDVNSLMVEAGLARVQPGGRTFSRRSLYRSVQDGAERLEAGVWGSCDGEFHVAGSVTY